MDADLFHEENPFKWNKQKLARARQVCARCPVTSECLNDALAMRTTWGMYGGMTYKERMEYRKGTGVVIRKRKRVSSEIA
jgi:WhiB family redox-sensing transcriptional regulator